MFSAEDSDERKHLNEVNALYEKYGIELPEYDENER